MKSNLNAAVVVGVMMVAGAVPAFGAPIVLNNSFEEGVVSNTQYTKPFGGSLDPATGIPSWTFSPSEGPVGGSGTYNGIVRFSSGTLNPPATMPDGNGSQYAFIETQGSISQSITDFEAGQVYTLSFYAAGRNNAGGAQTLQVKIGDLTLEFGGNTTLAPSVGAWNLYTSDEFTVPAGAHTLSFTGVVAADRTSFIDLVNINVVPEPMSGTMLAVGAVGLLARRRRRAK